MSDPNSLAKGCADRAVRVGHLSGSEQPSLRKTESARTLRFLSPFNAHWVTFDVAISQTLLERVARSEPIEKLLLSWDTERPTAELS